MAAKPNELSEADRDKEVIRRLQLALEDCRRCVEEANESVRRSHRRDDGAER